MIEKYKIRKDFERGIHGLIEIPIPTFSWRDIRKV
jgi:hypothetical protein